ncbi:MAG: hypothetical protein WC858_05070 [Parcubacteria group bacterium]|jgi:hypothetical protein
MISKNISLVALIVIAAVVAIAGYFFISSQGSFIAPSVSTNHKVSDSVEIDLTKGLPAPTGSVDDLAKELSASSKAEQQLTGDEDGDSALINQDIKVFDEFGQSYNENEF